MLILNDCCAGFTVWNSIYFTHPSQFVVCHFVICYHKMLHNILVIVIQLILLHSSCVWCSALQLTLLEAAARDGDDENPAHCSVISRKCKPNSQGSHGHVNKCCRMVNVLGYSRGGSNAFHCYTAIDALPGAKQNLSAISLQILFIRQPASTFVNLQRLE